MSVYQWGSSGQAFKFETRFLTTRPRVTSTFGRVPIPAVRSRPGRIRFTTFSPIQSFPTPSKQNFLFVRQKVQTTVKEFKKPVTLDSSRYGRNVTVGTLQQALRNDIVVSHSGRTLAEILSLSHSTNLSIYTVDNVVPGFGKDGTVVHYSQPCESEIAELRREVHLLRDKVDKQEAKLKAQQAEIDELKTKIGGDSEILAKWQTASLVMHAFGSFAWGLVSDFDKTELSQYEIRKFWDLYHARTGPGLARNFARRIYNKIDENIRCYANNLAMTKKQETDTWRKLAHPNIPHKRLQNFLSELGSGHAGLDPIEIEIFSYLESKSNDPENIERAIKGG